MYLDLNMQDDHAFGLLYTCLFLTIQMKTEQAITRETTDLQKIDGKG